MKKAAVIILAGVVLAGCNKKNIERDAFGGLKLGVKWSEEVVLKRANLRKTEEGREYKKLTISNREYYFLPAHYGINKDSIVTELCIIAYPSLEDLEAAKRRKGQIDFYDEGVPVSPINGSVPCRQTYIDVSGVLAEKYGSVKPLADSRGTLNIENHYWRVNDVEITLVNTWDTGVARFQNQYVNWDNIPRTYQCSVQILYRFNSDFIKKNNLDNYSNITDEF